MPLIVDKAERRAQVAEEALALIADRGIGAVTFRQVAEASGTSTAIVTHYFRDKNDLLYEVYRSANRRGMARVEAAFRGGAPLADCLVAVLPVTPEGARDWRVWLAFWGLAHAEPVFRAETAENAGASLGLYAAMLAARYRNAVPAGEIETLSRRLVATVGGLGLQACLAPGDWPIERLRGLIEAEIAALDQAAGVTPG